MTRKLSPDIAARSDIQKLDLDEKCCQSSSKRFPKGWTVHPQRTNSNEIRERQERGHRPNAFLTAREVSGCFDQSGTAFQFDLLRIGSFYPKGHAQRRHLGIP